MKYPSKSPSNLTLTNYENKNRKGFFIFSFGKLSLVIVLVAYRSISSTLQKYQLSISSNNQPLNVRVAQGESNYKITVII